MDDTLVFLGLGSNLGDREGNLRAALDALAHYLVIEAVSHVYQTEPYGPADQPAFLNVAVAASTDLSPPDLLSLCKQIEVDVGRRPTYRWGPRIVDIDILLYDGLTLETPELTIPHRDMLNRAFVLVPMAEIAPDLVHPGTGLPMRSLRNRLDASGVRLYQP